MLCKSIKCFGLLTWSIFAIQLIQSGHCQTYETHAWEGAIIPLYRGNLSDEHYAFFLDVIVEFEAISCVRFAWVESNCTACIRIVESYLPTCNAPVGKRRNVGTLNYGTNCHFKKWPLCHEFLHLAGIRHEHISPHRDNYVSILYENIQEDKFYLFEINYEITHYGCEECEYDDYDFNSLTHGIRKAYSKNGLATIVPKYPAPNMGQRTNFSECDVLRVNYLYRCFPTTTTLDSTQSSSTTTSTSPATTTNSTTTPSTSPATTTNSTTPTSTSPAPITTTTTTTSTSTTTSTPSSSTTTSTTTKKPRCFIPWLCPG